MSMKARNRAFRRSPEGQKTRIFDEIRVEIGKALQRPNLKVRAGSSMELAIGTFAPSEIIDGFEMSDYPFIGARYVSVRDGHVYIVAGATDDGGSIKAYRLHFVRSIFTNTGGIAVGLTCQGWMDSVMVMYSLTNAHFEMEGGEIQGVSDTVTDRRAYPIKKTRIFLAHLALAMRTSLCRIPMIARIVEARKAKAAQASTAQGAEHE